MAIERITQSALADLYDELDEELAKRSGYQRLDNLAPGLEEVNGTYWGDPVSTEPGTIKARVPHFNRAMKARQYIKTGTYSFNVNQEEWYQQSDKTKIETLINDMKNPSPIGHNCNNACSGTCSSTCAGTAAA